jgi:hypothetical protein
MAEFHNFPAKAGGGSVMVWVASGVAIVLAIGFVWAVSAGIGLS